MVVGETMKKNRAIPAAPQHAQPIQRPANRKGAAPPKIREQGSTRRSPIFFTLDTPRRLPRYFLFNDHDARPPTTSALATTIPYHVIISYFSSLMEYATITSLQHFLHFLLHFLFISSSSLLQTNSVTFIFRFSSAFHAHRRPRIADYVLRRLATFY